MSKKTMASVERALATSNRQLIEARVEVTSLRDRLSEVINLLSAHASEMSTTYQHAQARVRGIQRHAIAHDIPTVQPARKSK